MLIFCRGTREVSLCALVFQRLSGGVRDIRNSLLFSSIIAPQYNYIFQEFSFVSDFCVYHVSEHDVYTTIYYTRISKINFHKIRVPI